MIEIKPIDNAFDKTVTLPGSKYIANRLMILASLAEGKSTLMNVPDNEDINIAQKGMEGLGAKFTNDNSTIHVVGVAGKPIVKTKKIYTAASGTFSRFVLGAASLCYDPVYIIGNEKMNTRPMKSLIQALQSLEVDIEHDDYHLPVTVKGPIQGGEVDIDASQSSQYISSLLLAGVYMEKGIEVHLKGHKVSSSYILMTIDLMRKFKVDIEKINDRHFLIQPGQSYQAQDISIETDPLSSSYFLGITALTGSRITIPNFNLTAPQWESRFVEVLKQMGCSYTWENQRLVFQGPNSPLQAVDVDMSDMPDAVQTLAILACFSKGVTHIKNIEHLKHKESDRIGDTSKELKKLGVEVKHTDSSLTIVGGTPKGAVIDPHSDHRMAMSFAIAGVKVPGIRISHPEVTTKSFPGYWKKLEELGVALIYD